MDDYDKFTAVVNSILLTMPNYPWIITVPRITQRGYPRFCMHWYNWPYGCCSAECQRAGSYYTKLTPPSGRLLLVLILVCCSAMHYFAVVDW